MVLARERYQSQYGLSTAEADALWPDLPARATVDDLFDSGGSEFVEDTETISATDVEAPARDDSGKFVSTTS